MGHKPTLQDLKDVHPTIHHSLQKLLTHNGAAQLGLVFQVCHGGDQLVLNITLHLMLCLTLNLVPKSECMSCTKLKPVGALNALCVDCESKAH